MTPQLTVVPGETALLVVDMQNGFCDPKGSMALAELDYEPQHAIIPTVKELVDVCHDAGIRVMWSMQRHYPNDATRSRRRIPTHLQKLGVNVCTKDTWDAEIVDRLKIVIDPQDEVFEKHRSSCFYNTTLETKLKAQGITTLIVCGVATNYCVDSTIRDAYARDFDIIVIEDAVAALWADLHQAALKNFELMYGMVMPLSTLKTVLSYREAVA